jgi:hypothetical protein
MSDPRFDSVHRVFQSSHLYGVWRSLADVVAAASLDSALLRPLRSFASTCTQQSPGRKLAFSAATIGVTALALLAIRATLPQYATSGLPWWWNVTAAVFAFGIAIAADAVASAWIDSTPARIWRRLTA